MLELFARCVLALFLPSIALATEPGPLPRAVHIDRYGQVLPSSAIARLGMPPPLSGFAWSVTWSSDGRRFIVADLNGVLAFDAATGRPIGPVPGTEGIRAGSDITARDGSTLIRLDGATGALIDCITGDKLLTFQLPDALGAPGRRPFSLSVNANHRFLAGLTSGTAAPRVAWRLDLAHGRVVRQVSDRADLHSVRIAPDGKRLFAAGGTAEPELTARDIVTGKELWTTSLKNMSTIRAVSADGRRLVVSDSNGVSVFDTSSGKPVMSMPIESAAPPGLWGIAIAPNGERLALADGTQVLVWRVGTGSVEQRFPCTARLAAFAPDGQSLLTASIWVQRWDLASGRNMYEQPRLARPIGATVMHWSTSSGRLLALQRAERTRGEGDQFDVLTVWDSLAMKEVWSYVSAEPIQAATIDAPGAVVRAFISSGELRTWRLAMPDARVDLPIPVDQRSRGGRQPSFRDDGRLLLQYIGATEITTHIHDDDGHPVHRQTVHFLPQRFRRNGVSDMPVGATLFLSAGARLDLLTGRPRPPLTMTSQINSYVGMPVVNCDLFIAARVGTADGIHGGLWEELTGRQITGLPAQLTAWGHAVVSPNGQFVAAADDHFLYIHDLRRQSTERIAVQGITCIAFAPDCRSVATALRDSTVMIWRTPTATPAPWQPKQAEVLWNNLAAADAGPAWKTIWHLLDHPQKALALLGEHLRPAPAMADTGAQIARLNHARYAQREQAMKELAERGDTVEGDLRAALKVARTAEQEARLEQLLARLDPTAPPASDVVRGLRTLWLLERIGTAEAGMFINRMTGGPPGARVTIEARAAAERMANQRR